MKTTKQDIKLLAELQKRDLSILSDDAVRLRHLSRGLRKLFECQCNGCTRDKRAWESWAQYDKARDEQMQWVEKRVEALEARLEKLCKVYSIPYYIQSDPRGCALYLFTTDDSRYSTEGIAVY